MANRIYKTIWCMVPGDVEGDTDIINEMAREGWEVLRWTPVAFVEESSNTIGLYDVFLLTMEEPAPRADLSKL